MNPEDDDILLLWYKNGNCSISDKARAYAAAGSDARMNGCELPVCIISGSGNQGITASVPVVIYAKELGKSEDEMLRAVLLSDLITTHLKTGIGCLSAYCGAISAGCGCGAGIAYLKGGKFKEIAHTIVNALAILSGTICLRLGHHLAENAHDQQLALQGAHDVLEGGVDAQVARSMEETVSCPKAWKIPLPM